MKIGSKNPQGTVAYDSWEKIYEHEISASDTEAQLLATFSGQGGAVSGTADTGQAMTFAGSAQLVHSNNNITYDGDPEIDTAQYKFGSSSLALDGNDYVAIQYNGNTDFSAGQDFTIDMQVRFSDVSAHQGIWEQREDATNQNRMYSYWNTSGNLYWRVVVGGSNVVEVIKAWSPSVDTWYHLAFVRNGSTWTMYVNGTSIGSTTDASNPVTCDDPFTIGYGAGAYNRGWIDEFRVSNNKARWTSNFTAPTSAYTTDGHTNVLMHFEGTDGSTTFTDEVDGKIGESCLGLDGNSDYVTVPDSTDWDFGSGDFTVDGWVYIKSTPSSYSFFYQGTYGVYPTQYIRINGNKVQYFYSSSAGNYVSVAQDSDASITLDTWHHIEISRESGTFYIFIDGVEYANTATVLGTPTYAGVSGALQIGRFDTVTDVFFDGYIDALRVTKGECLHTSNFTPPTTIDDYVGTSAITIFGLEGDADEQYMLDINIEASGGGTGYSKITFNGDTGTNYGYQTISGNSTTITAGRNPNAYLLAAYTASASTVGSSNVLIHAKSGYVRTVVCDVAMTVTGTTVTQLLQTGQCWNNTADELTSITITPNTNSFAVGSTISLYRRITA